MENKKLIIINVGIALFLLLIWWVVSNWKEWGDEENGNVMMQFLGVMSITVVVGLLFVTVILPGIGDRIGEYFYSAPEKIEPDAYSKAASKLAQGDYEGALADYRKISHDEPENRFPVIEVAKIQQEHFKDVDGAIHTIEEAVQGREWGVNDAAFMIFRLHDLYLEHKGDKETARTLLQQVIEQFPDTRHSANAHHKLNELNQMA